MAGVAISKDRKWICARWVFFYVLEMLKDKVPVDRRLRKAIELALVDGIGRLDLEDMPGDQVESFRTEVIKLYDDLKRQGPSCFAEPEFYPGAMERISELIELPGGRD